MLIFICEKAILSLPSEVLSNLSSKSQNYQTVNRICQLKGHKELNHYLRDARKFARPDDKSGFMDCHGFDWMTGDSASESDFDEIEAIIDLK